MVSYVGPKPSELRDGYIEGYIGGRICSGADPDELCMPCAAHLFRPERVSAVSPPLEDRTACVRDDSCTLSMARGWLAGTVLGHWPQITTPKGWKTSELLRYEYDTW